MLLHSSPGVIFAGHAVQKVQTFLEFQVFGQGNPQFRRIQGLDRIDLWQLGLIGEVLIEQLKCGNFVVV